MSTTVVTQIPSIDHPLLDACVLETRLTVPLGSSSTPPELVAMLLGETTPRLPTDEAIKPAVRRLLRHGGFKPSGRNKPASEYLVQAIGRGRLSSINPAVDALNVASSQGGLPISVVDQARLVGSPRIGLGAAGDSYVFNASGQTIDIAGLLCLFDEAGPCANAVKDSQRTKTCDETQVMLSVIWGTNELPGRTMAVAELYRELLDTYVP